MHTELISSGHQRGNLWTDELPNVPQFHAPFRRVDLAAGTVAPTCTRLAADVTFPRGAMIVTGMLGLIVTPGPKSGLLVPEAPRLHGAYQCEGWSERLCVGLEPEFVAAVIEGVQEAARRPSGTIQIACAAFSDIGSSHQLFANLATFLLHVATGGTIDEQMVRALPPG